MPRRLTLCAFALACAAVVLFFHQGPSGNGESRLMTVFSLVEQHRFIGDDFADLTWDKALVDRHYYSDKAPLSSYLVLPFYWVYRHDGGPMQRPRDVEAANHIAIVVAAALPFGLFAALLWWRSARAGSSDETVWLVLLAAFGTFVVNYGNSYFGHVLCGAFLLGAWVLAIDRARHFAWAGLCAGCAVATEYPSAIAVAFMLIALFRGEDRARRVGWFLVGAIPPALLFFAHNAVVTGHALQLPYSHVVDTWKPMQTAFGIRYPRPRALWNLAVSPYRGLLFYAPILLVLGPLLWKAQRRLSLWILIACWIFISSYYTWDGGWCTGPRHLTAPLMLCLYEGLAVFVAQPRHRRLFLALGVTGVLLNTAFAATNPLPSAHNGNPLVRLVLPDLWAGRMNPHNVASELLHVAARRRLLLVWLVLIAMVGLIFSRMHLHRRPSSPPAR